MCGIVGYIGKEQAAPIILDGLSKLEYRGYDSAGMAIMNENIQVKKAVGRLKQLEELTKNGETMPGNCGIGHTRWATHGVPSDTNSHPHCNKKKTIAVVHNGIIENYIYLRNKLKNRGYEFCSETDTEVIAHMLDYYYEENPMEAITKVLHRIEGSYAFGIMFADYPGKIFAARKGSPLIVAKNETGAFIASDVPAILRYTKEVYYIDDKEVVCLSEKDVRFFTLNEEEIEKESVHIKWDVDAAEKDGYEHFMLKEMYQQPGIIEKFLQNTSQFDEFIISDNELEKFDKLHIVACGSAYHVGITSKYVIEEMSRISVEVDLASEFRYRNPILDKNTLVLAISQSGETADTLEALRQAKERGCKVLSIVNVMGSSIAREADYVIYTMAGPEIAVATTKAYSAQLVAMYLFAIKLGKVKKILSETQISDMMKELNALPRKMEELLMHKEKLQKFANRYIGAKDIFFMGRGIDYAISLEGSLKLKEISYIHSEAYAAGELKHGTISLIEEGTLVLAVLTQPKLYAKTISNMVEVKARGAFVLAITSEENKEIEKTADYVVYIPKTNPLFANSLAIVPLQLFSYYVAVGKGVDVDKPRNLAKSVTVE